MFVIIAEGMILKKGYIPLLENLTHFYTWLQNTFLHLVATC